MEYKKSGHQGQVLKDAFAALVGLFRKGQEPENLPYELNGEDEDAVKFWKRRTRQRRKIGPVRVGWARQIGSRPSQQDCSGVAAVAGGRGTLAVLADGMGGLSDSERVSKKVVKSMLYHGAQLGPEDMDGALRELTEQVNEDVNQMLGEDGLCKSGSTLVAALVEDGAFHWLSVGDSRVYLYRNGKLIQLNQEHTQFQERMEEILDGGVSYDQARDDPDSAKLSSFIGMGELRHIDESLYRIRLNPGERILLMSDGVFTTLPEKDMEQILAQFSDVRQAAGAIEQQILDADVLGQDNFTVIVLGV